MTRLLIRWRQLLVLTLLLLCSVGALSARPLSKRQARHLAEQFFLQSTRTTMSRPISQQGLQLVSAPVRDARGLQLRSLSGEEARYYYIYNRGSNEGFVIIAGDDELTPNGKDILSTKKLSVREDTEIKATFTKKSYTVTFTPEGEGKLTATRNGEPFTSGSPAYEGDKIVITAQPAKGYQIDKWLIGKEEIEFTPYTGQTTFECTVGTADVLIKATFAKKSYTVTFTPEGEGENKLTATRNGEPFTSGSPAQVGDKIVITAQPAEGYQIDKWLIGKEEIEFTPYTGQTTFECTVGTADVLIKATFTKKTYPVTLTHNEHGTISIVGPVDLTAVPYGTTLTVQAMGKNAQCELTALTANGKDILSSKQFTVQGATEVKATFVDHTSVETIGGHTVRIYPNPAQTFVLIEGLQPASQVSLYSMNGKQLYTGQTDQQGALRIDLTALSDGVYLLIGKGWQKRLVVKQ